MAPLVSVVIPTFNRTRYLQQAIESVLSQTMPDLEVIVVDDGSTDDTRDLVESLSPDARLRYVYQSNQGRSVARNHGAHLARGEFLGFLDSDDSYLPRALEINLQSVSQDPGMGMTVGGYQYVDESGRRSGERQPWTEEGDLGLRGWLYNCYAIPGSVLIRKTWFNRTAGFDSRCEIAEDWALFLELAVQDCPMSWTRETVCQYRQHPGGSIHDIARHRDGALHAVSKVFQSSNLPSTIAASKNKVQAWVHVLYAKKSFSLGLPAVASESLREAIQLDPSLNGERKVEMLEFLLSPGVIGRDAPGNSDSVLEDLQGELGVERNESRHALARVEMARFFRLASNGAKENAIAYLVAGIKYDPTWIANTGVLTFSAKYILNMIGNWIRRRGSTV